MTKEAKFNYLMNNYLKCTLYNKLVDDFYPVYDVVINQHNCGIDIYLYEEGFDCNDPQDEYMLMHLHNSDILFAVLNYKKFKESLEEKRMNKLQNKK